MPYCPECRFEYRPSVRQCPDCGAGLVDHLPEEPEPKPNEGLRQVVLCTVCGHIPAGLIGDALTSQKIPYRVQAGSMLDGGEPAAQIIGDVQGHPYRVYVNQRDLAQARVIVSDFERHPPSEADLAQEWPEVEEDASEEELDD